MQFFPSNIANILQPHTVDTVAFDLDHNDVFGSILVGCHHLGL